MRYSLTFTALCLTQWVTALILHVQSTKCLPIVIKIKMNKHVVKHLVLNIFSVLLHRWKKLMLMNWQKS